jgi:hypothetical protein
MGSLGDNKIEVALRVEPNKTTARTITVWWITCAVPEFDLIPKSLYFPSSHVKIRGSPCRRVALRPRMAKEAAHAQRDPSFEETNSARRPTAHMEF